MRAIEAGLLSRSSAKGVSYERARCLKGIPLLEHNPLMLEHTVNPEPTFLEGRTTAARVSNPSLNNLAPGNRAFGYRRIIALIGIAPKPNCRPRRTGIGGIIVAIVVAAVIGSRRERSPE
jgi:hypothetical protein